MTETNPLDVIGPYLPLKVAQDKYDEDTYLLLSNDGSMQFDRDCSDKAALNAIASILNAAPAQAAEIERLRTQIEELGSPSTMHRNFMEREDRLRADNAKLRSALEYYALGYADDNGGRAARALAETEPRPSVVRRSEVPGDEPHDGRESHL